MRRQPVRECRPRHRHADLEVHLVVAGTGRVEVAGSTYDLAPGDLVRIDPDVPHGPVGSGRGLRRWVVVADRSLVRPDLARPDPVRWLRGADLQWLQSRLVELSLLTGDPDRFDAGLAYVVLSALRLGDRPRRRAADTAVVDVLARMDADGTARSLPELAAGVGLSASQLARSFRAATGMSVVEYRHHQQVQRYLDLCGATGIRSAADAAHAAGFGSYAQFHRVFRKVMGCSPRDYRRPSPPR